MQCLIYLAHWLSPHLFYICMMCRVILENFGFITDEISAKEDLAWSTGPSGTQFLEYVHTFEQSAAGTPMVSISAGTSTLLFHQKVPLGFRTNEGDLEFEEVERVGLKYIRAELNVLLRRKHLAAERFHQRWKMLYPLFHTLEKIVPGPPKRFVNGVQFVDLTKVLVYWRKPSLTPDVVKAGRKEIVEEAIIMACALTIFEFLRRIVARKRQEETVAKLSGAMMLSRWMRSDQNYCRRSEHYRAVKAELSETARERRTSVLRLEWPAAALVSLEMEQSVGPEEVVSGLVGHHDMVLLQKLKVLRPKHGLEALRRGAAAGAVVVRFVDLVHKGLGARRLDLRGWSWDGWGTFPTDGDAFLRPTRVSPTREPAIWTDLTIRMPQVSADANEKGFPVDGSSGEIVWTVLDLQSFLEESDGNEGESIIVRSVVRIHLAQAAVMNNTEQRETQTSAAVEVIGYIQLGASPTER
jgi:hypothetical protein